MNLIKYKNWFFAFSLIIITPGIISLKLWGLKLGIDFAGGTLWEIQFLQHDAEISPGSFQNFLNENGAQVSSSAETGPSTILIRMAVSEESKISQIREKIASSYGPTEDLRLETVGPIISEELTRKASTAVIFAIIAIVLYVTWSFRKVPKPTSSLAFGVCTIFALTHDVLVVIGIFAIIGHYFAIEVDSLFITALLTVIGFSVHDTIVVFDRIRENLKKEKDTSFEKVVNNSLLETMARSLNTSLTAIFVLIALLLFGGQSIKIFILALLIGVASGTYSSIFNAAPLLVVWDKFARKK